MLWLFVISICLSQTLPLLDNPGLRLIIDHDILYSNDPPTHPLTTSDVNYGHQIWTQSGSDWPQMGQIREFFKSDSVHGVRFAPNWTNEGFFSDQIQYILAHKTKMYWIWSEKNPRFVPFGANLIHFGFKSGHRDVKTLSVIATQKPLTYNPLVKKLG